MDLALRIHVSIHKICWFWELSLANVIPRWMQLQDILEGPMKHLILVASGPLAFVKCGIMKYPSPG